ncbi:MAG: Gldg family protein [Treponema sp.]|nr:Gldg family protein [Treponema sp.]
MKKFLNWLKSSKSDFVLFVILLVLANIAGHSAFLRFDLTGPKSYSLSKASKSLVKNLEEPLSIRIFFDDKLPAPYSSVAQYVKDILVEYKGAGNKNLSVIEMDMSKPENSDLARELGLSQIQIQEVKNNEVGFKQGYMGIALTYGDNIEVLNPITSTDGLEYKLTSKISKMISMSNTLAGLKGGDKIKLTLYYSDAFEKLGINGSDQIEGIVKKSYESVNKKNMDRLDFVVSRPASAEVDDLAQKYGIQKISYRDQSGNVKAAALGLVLELGEKFYALPLEIQNSFFGYMFTGLDDLDNSITEGLQSLLSNVTEIGYITGHNELDHTAENYSANFDRLISGMYELVDLDLNKDNIPAGMNSIIINGPQYDYTEEELYKIDQFLMRGGNVMFFIDGMVEDGTAQYTGGQQYVANESNLDRLLEKYGVKREKNIVMDKNGYEYQNNQVGKQILYWAPVLQKDHLAKKNPITNNLGYVVMYQNSALDVSAAQADSDLKTTVLVTSSDESWKMDQNIILNPVMLAPPAELKSENLLVLVEGKFKSAFDQAVISKQLDEEGNEIELPEGDLDTSKHVSASIMPGKIFVSGSSYLTTRQLIDEGGSTPVSMLLMNVVDYMNGNAELCTMRTKSLSVNTLTVKSSAAANFWKYFNEYGLVVILALVGLLVLRLRSKRRAAINRKYNPDDTRTITK